MCHGAGGPQALRLCIGAANPFPGQSSPRSILPSSIKADKLLAVQTGMPMTALSVLGGQFRLKPQTRAQLYQDFLPWSIRAGFRSADLMCLYYEKHFEVYGQDIADMADHCITDF